MYVPEHFREDDTETLHRYVRDYSFGLFVIADDDGIEANHVPFHFQVDPDNSLGTLQCHLARTNPAWKRIEKGGSVLAIFQGPDAYVSPSWYATKAETGRVVPTWNYLAVHAKGTARVVQDPSWLKEHLHILTDRHERDRAQPWSVDDAPEEYTERLMQGIVGIEIRIEELTGKLKASQNQPQANQEGVQAGLRAESAPHASTMADLVSKSDIKR